MSGIGHFGPEPTPLADWFWPKVQKGPGCWFWIAGGDGKDGYGRIRIAGKGTLTALAHQVAWELTNGPVPDGFLVCHRCDVKRCVRPDHLFLGDYTENMQDASRKGRMQHGEAWYRSRPQWRRRVHHDPVTQALRAAVARRDGQCVLAKLEPDHICRDVFGNVHRSDDRRSLSIEHVHDSYGRMGKRAPSDLAHCLALCADANIGVPSKSQRTAFRAYLAAINA